MNKKIFTVILTVIAFSVFTPVFAEVYTDDGRIDVQADKFVSSRQVEMKTSPLAKLLEATTAGLTKDKKDPKEIERRRLERKKKLDQSFWF